MLLQILEYIRCQRVASNQQIAREFNLDIQALQPMLDWWIRKRGIALCEESSCQSQCFKCKAQSLVYYQALK